MNQSGRVILITGASSGLGKAAALEFLDRGWRVYAAARRVELMSDVEERGGRALRMDVTDDSSVQAGVQIVMDECGRIDALVANAGYGAYGATELVPIPEIRRQFEVNYFGVLRAVRAVLPHMREQRSGRVIITGSVAAHISTSGIGFYSSTKHALHALGVALRQEVHRLGIRVCMIEPGVIKTEFDGVAETVLHAVEAPEDYRRIQHDILAYVTHRFRTAPSPKRTVGAMVRAASARWPRSVYRIALDGHLFPIANRLLAPRLADVISLAIQRSAARKMERRTK